MFQKLALSPLLAMQALMVAAKAQQLPEPEGPRSGHPGKPSRAKPGLSLLLLGDSSFAGVGASHQSRALSGQLVAQLTPHLNLTWQLTAKTGATSASTLRTLNSLPPNHFDIALLGLGVNDVTRLAHPASWQKRQEALHDALQQKFGVQKILRTGVPPMQHFSLLPQPLRHFLGQDAARLDAALAALCAKDSRLKHIPLDLPFEPHYLARDGFHPSEAAYALWARQLAPHILDQAQPLSYCR